MSIAEEKARLNSSAIELFESFARFEYALKAAGFCNKERSDGKPTKAEADWTAFAESISGYLSSSQDREFNIAKEFILSSPPKQQIVEGGSWKWQEVDRTESRSKTESARAKVLLLHVRQVRNNLFHGGKIVDGEWYADDGRSEKLVGCSITILRECLKACPEIEAKYK